MKSRYIHFGDPVVAGHDPQFMENVLNDLAPQDPAGLRRLRPSRRGLIRLGTGLVAITMLPVPACEPQQVEQGIALAVLLFKAGKEIYDLSQTISGQTMLVNDGDKTVRLESLFKLLEAFAGGGEADSYSPDAPWKIPPGDSSFNFGQLNAANVGEHLVQMLLAGTSYETDPFMVS